MMSIKGNNMEKIIEGEDTRGLQEQCLSELDRSGSISLATKYALTLAIKKNDEILLSAWLKNALTPCQYYKTMRDVCEGPNPHLTLLLHYLERSA